jgi:hypothetical protein
MFMVLPEMIDGCIYHDLPQPAFKGTDNIRVSRTVMMYLFENFQEPVIEYLYRILLLTGIPVTNRHSIPVERAV